MSELFSKSNDGKIRQNGLIMSTDEVIDYLNTSNNAIGSLQYENAKLRKENKRLKERNDELEESSAFIIEQREENKQLKKAEKINMEYAEQIVEENQKLRISKNDLRREKEQLQKENEQLHLAIEDLLTHTSCEEVKKENSDLRQNITIIKDLLSECDLFSDKATKHDIIAYKEMRQFDNKDAYCICTAIKKAIEKLKRCNDE